MFINNTRRAALLTVLIPVLLTGLLFISCPEPDDTLPELTGTITIDNTSPREGDTLTAEYKNGNGEGNATWEWLRGDETIDGAHGDTYHVVEADLNKTLSARVSYDDKSGYVTSQPTSAVGPKTIDTPPELTGTVTIDNTSPQVGDTLTATYTGGNGSGTATWEWLRGEETIDGTHSNTYHVVEADLDSALIARVSYADQSSYVESEPTDPVTEVPVPEFTDVTDLAEYLASVEPNTAANPVQVKISIPTAAGNWGSLIGSIIAVLSTAERFVALDLSSSTGPTSTFGTSGTGRDYIVSLTLPDTITTISSTSFNGWGYTSSIILPAGLTQIGQNGFYGCTGLTCITIPASVTMLQGANNFSGCSGLTSVIFEEGCQITSIPTSCFNACAKLASITIPASVTSIGGTAFNGCVKLASVTFGDNPLLVIASPGFPGNLKVVYDAETVRAGTYTRSEDPEDEGYYLDEWTKQ